MTVLVLLPWKVFSETRKIANQAHNISRPVPPNWTMQINPTFVMTSYFDYMIGGFNGLPLRTVPYQGGGGYFMSFSGKRLATNHRRAFYAHLSSSGILVNCNELSSINQRENYPAVAFDAVSGKPFYAWHANNDSNDPEPDNAQEIEYTTDACLSGIAGMINPVRVAINNPFTVIAPDDSTTTNNEFLMASVTTGPSPLPGHRRVYILGRNAVTHTIGQSQNALIAYSDFTAEMIEEDVPLTWNHTSIPVLNAWNVDQTASRRPFYDIAADESGYVYVVGYHTTYVGGSIVHEPDIDVFSCSNYGTGTWTYQAFSSQLPSWNPQTQSGTGFFVGVGEIPLQDNELFWKIKHSQNMNITFDASGRLHMIGLWHLMQANGTIYQELNCVKDFIYDPVLGTGSIYEIYPISRNFMEYYQPWDIEEPFGEVDYNLPNGDPDISYDWNFPYWDSSPSNNANLHNYNNLRITSDSQSGRLLAVWQNSWRARQYNYHQDPDYSDYANVPEIFISISPSNGQSWSEPIVINALNTPTLAGQTPMWVYPADRIIPASNYGLVGLIYYNDYTWGSFAVTPPAHPSNDGGQVFFMEVGIQFSNETPTTGISGRITNGLTTEPIAAAMLVCAGQTAYSNQQGFYNLYLGTGSYDLSVTADGYLPVTVLDIAVGEGGFTMIDIELTPNTGIDEPQEGSDLIPVLTRGITEYYPNPFSNNIDIKYNLDSVSELEIGIYDIRGRHVRSLHSGVSIQKSGSINWDGWDKNGIELPSGVYFLRMISPGIKSTVKLLKVK